MILGVPNFLKFLKLKLMLYYMVQSRPMKLGVGIGYIERHLYMKFEKCLFQLFKRKVDSSFKSHFLKNGSHS